MPPGSGSSSSSSSAAAAAAATSSSIQTAPIQQDAEQQQQQHAAEQQQMEAAAGGLDSAAMAALDEHVAATEDADTNLIVNYIPSSVTDDQLAQVRRRRGRQGEEGGRANRAAERIWRRGRQGEEGDMAKLGGRAMGRVAAWRTLRPAWSLSSSFLLFPSLCSVFALSLLCRCSVVAMSLRLSSWCARPCRARVLSLSLCLALSYC